MSYRPAGAPPAQRDNRLVRYYRLHARIYDFTRWSFLFGRMALIEEIAQLAQPKRILEIGCGTGANLVRLARRFPEAQVTGIDLSADMLAQASKRSGNNRERIELIHGAYQIPLRAEQPFDLIVCSYALSLINPGWEQVIESCNRDLSEGGLIAVVDFHDSSLALFRLWMRLNHVRMDAHLAPKLKYHFRTRKLDFNRAYAGLWRYFLFIGEN